MSRLCVIFDLDGTLVDSETLNCRAFLELLPEISESAGSLAKRYRGMKLAEILSDISSRYLLKLGGDFESEYRARVADLYDAHLSENEGVSSLLRSLSYDLCVASSAPYKKIAHALAVTNLSDFFGDNLFSSYEIGFWKPNPGLFLHASSEMGSPPGSCVVIEDSIPGVQAGIAAGMHVCHYRGLSDFDGQCRPFSEMAQLSDMLRDIQRAI